MGEVVEICEWVPVGHIENYRSIMHNYGGRFIRNPTYWNDKVRVNVSIPADNYRKFSDSVLLLTTTIREVDHRRWYTKYLNRFVAFCKGWLK